MNRSFKAGLALAALLTPISLLAATADVMIPKSNETKVQSDITKAEKTLSDIQKLGQEIKQYQVAAASGSKTPGAVVRTAAETTTTTTTAKKPAKKAANGKAKTTPKKKKNP